MKMSPRQFANLRQWKGRPASEVDRAYSEYCARLEAVDSPLDAVAEAENPRAAIRELLPVVVRDLKKWLALEARRAKPEPAVTSRLAECRQLIAAATAYEETNAPEEQARAIADAIAERWENANWSGLSPEPPEVPEEEPDPAVDVAPQPVVVPTEPEGSSSPEPEPLDPEPESARPVCPICAGEGTVTMEGELFACPQGPHQ